MNRIDEQFTRTPFYGVPRMTAQLKRLGHTIGKKLVRRLMRQMGLEAIYPKPRTSQQKYPKHKVYPYLLRDVEITRPSQVWSADITYIRLNRGFAYLIAILDWFSRYVLSWRLSSSLECLDEAFESGRSEIFNTDQGVQFTSLDFTQRLIQKNVLISMDGRGRVFDNIFVERLWRSVKYENVYIHDYSTIPEAREGLKHYFEFYNAERLHESLGYQTPWEIFSGSRNVNLLPQKQMIFTP